MTQPPRYVIVPRIVTSNGLSARIVEARKGAGMKQVDLASASGLSLGTIRNYEGSRTTPARLENLRKIAHATNVDLLWLVDGDRIGEEVA